MSELSPAACFSPAGAAVVGSCGKLLPNTQGRIVCPVSGAGLGPDQPGELLIRGPQVMKGYLNNPAATAATLRDDWLMSGDIAYRDKEGNIFMVDRMKEMIKVKALQVSPSELEDILRTHQEVMDTAVLSCPDDKYGEVPRAYVVKRNRKADSQTVAASIHDYLNTRIADHKRLRGGIVFMDTIPRSPAGKILKKNIRTMTKVEAW